jgi:predicted RNA-binding Zn-ribbon protein involved in translation (DUF1610 family)
MPRWPTRRRRKQPHLCPACELPFVRLDSSARHGSDWLVTLRCANCGWTAEEVLDEETVGRLQREIDRGTEQLVELLELVTGRRLRR